MIFVYVLESFDFLSGLFREDISYISSLIVSIFVFYLFRGGYYLFKLRDATTWVKIAQTQKIMFL